jgi:asparagine synthase (glutamine-hydrolysing)
MSGIVGIVKLDGSPVDSRLLRGMTQFMAYRGPDDQATWIDGPVGFGHTMLRTTTESAREKQPCSLDGEVWITADARVDGRKDLIRKLESAGRNRIESPTDVELLLHAYHVWGEACVDHLLGDFAFAVWDGRQQRLFCARDHFGIRLFYYARLQNCLIFSNTLDCIREHPAVSDALNEIAIGDFLLFDLNQDPATTFFSAIKCLPPAHSLTLSSGEARLRQYWTLPFDQPIRYKRSRDYVDHFLELLRTVVGNRLRTDRIAIYMSGGLDSTSAAATARDLLAEQFASFELSAYTVVYDRLIPDEERHYSRLAAEALGIPIHYLSADDYRLFERWDEPELRPPEPDNSPRRAIVLDQLRQISTRSRVAFYCEGPDNFLQYEWRPYVTDLITRGRLARLLADVGLYVASHRRLPLVPGILNRVRNRIGRTSDIATYPSWLNAAFASRFNLRQRWEEWQCDPGSDHPIRPRACASLKLANWRYLFESRDPGITGVPVEVSHPFMDLRMARYLLAVPPIPWCADKHIVRRAMRGRLPEPLLRRPKTTLAGDPVSRLLKRFPDWWREQPDFVSEMAAYVQADTLSRTFKRGYDSVSANWMNLRPFSLSYWLRDSGRENSHQCHRNREEKHDEIEIVGICQEVL